MDFLITLAEGCMPFLYLLRDVANPVFDLLFALITHLGEETVFLVISIIFFWCVDKREGYFILISGLFGTLINQAAKLACRVPRPWVIDPNFEIVEAAREEATGYSFPSGHTQNVSTTFGAIAAYNKKRWVTVISVVIILLVAFSRMYLGVHTPLDVSVSLLVGLALIVGLRPLFATEEGLKKSLPYIVAAALVASIAFLGFSLAVSRDSTLAPENLESALKNSCTLLGCTLGLVLVYFVDTRYTNFKTEAKWYAQIIKAALGFAIILLIKSGLSTPLTLLFGGNALVARVVRYFLIVAFAGVLWPLTFEKFSKLQIPFLDRLADKRLK